MSQVIIDIGNSADDGTGDTIREAGSKINEMFNELYARPSFESIIRIDGNKITTSASNADIDLDASGPGSIVFPAIKINGNNIEATRSNEDLGFVPQGTGSVVIDGLGFSGTSIIAKDSSLVNINEGLNVDGNISGTGTFTVTGAVTLSSTLGVTGATTLNSLATTQTSDFQDAVTIDNITIGGNIISTSSNADLILTPGGTGSVVIANLTLDANINITDNEIKATETNSDIVINAAGTGDIRLGAVRISGTTVTSDDSSSINVNDGLAINGTALIKNSVTLDSTLAVSSDITVTGNLVVSGDANFVGPTTIDNLSFDDNIIASSSDADIEITPGGTGSVNISNLTTDSSINLTDNIIKTTTSNANIQLGGNGTGQVEILSGLTTVGVTTTGNVDITGTKTITGQMDVEGIQIKDNSISTDESNSNLLISGNSSGVVSIDPIDTGSGEIDNVVIGGSSPAAGSFSSLTFSDASSATLTTTGVTITDNIITANSSNDNLELNGSGTGGVIVNSLTLPASDGGTGQFLQTDGSGTLSFATVSIAFSESVLTDTSQNVAFRSNTEFDAVTSIGDHDLISSTTTSVDRWATSKYDSALYLMIHRDDASGEFEIAKHSVCHNNTGAFISSYVLAKTGTNNHTSMAVDIADDHFRLRGSGLSSQNSVAYYRIGLGDADSTGYSGQEEASIAINTDLSSGEENLDTFAKGSFRGAKYFISVNNDSKTEVSNIECVVVHNGTNAFISSYGEVNSGSNSLINLTADINGSDVRLRATGNESNLRVHMYRILLADNEADRSVSNNVSVTGDTTVDSSATTIDTFDSSTFQGAHYVIVSNNSTEGSASICEAAVVVQGTNAFVVQYANTSTKTTDQITLSVSHDGSSTVSLQATSTSGGSTKVNVYRISLTRGAGTSTAIATLDSNDITEVRAVKYLLSIVDDEGSKYQFIEANVTHDGSDAYISTFAKVSNVADDLVTITADVDSGNMRLRGQISNVNTHVVKTVKRVINV